MKTALQPIGRKEYQKGYAKINLTLDVMDTREDGFHEVSMIMQNIRVWDDIELEVIEGEEITFESNVPFLEANHKNLAYRAAARMKEIFGIQGGLKITMDKRIPISAGLAGGSADAAAVLRGVNRLYNLGLSKGQLMRIGAELGSDVPYCVLGGTCLATGRGEIVTRLEHPMMPAHVVLVKPNFGISTPWAYAEFDKMDVDRRPDHKAMEAAMASGDLRAVGREMVNLLEPVALKEYPVLQEIKDDLWSYNAAGVMMSGSGPTIYALYEGLEDAQNAVTACRAKYPYKYQVIYTQIVTDRRV